MRGMHRSVGIMEDWIQCHDDAARRTERRGYLATATVARAGADRLTRERELDGL
jgi:hypothetical protein